MKQRGFTLLELLVVVAIISTLCVLGGGAVQFAMKQSSLAISASNIRQLAAGGAAYLADHNHQFWPYKKIIKGENPGTQWWFGFEPSSPYKPEGERILLPEEGLLGGYVAANFKPDPSFKFTGKPFKAKFAHGYIGIGYNLLLADENHSSVRAEKGDTVPSKYWDLERPGEVVVFATSAQVNTFQRPASAKNPMIEEYYGLDERQATVHFRHGGKAMVAFASGSVGFLEMDPSTLDKRAPEAKVGRFAPKGSSIYLR